MQCSHCGREVQPTVHSKEGSPPYKADYYVLLTGKLSHVSMQNPSNESETIEFYKLKEPIWVTTCCDCMDKEDIKAELDRMFSGVPDDVEEEPAAD